VGGGCLAVGLVIVGLWWKGCVCCDCEACLVWVVPWVDIFGEPVCGLML
jgi:hypothetical protein